MQKYMITITLPAFFTQEYMALIPKQRAKIIQLLTKGRLSSFSLSNDRSKAWMVASCKDLADLHRMLERFPMHSFFEYEISELMLHDTEFMGLPKVVLN